MLEVIGEATTPEAPWTADSVGTFIQAVLQGSFIFAKAQQGPEVAHANIAHLHRYLDMLFPRALHSKKRGSDVPGRATD